VLATGLRRNIETNRENSEREICERLTEMTLEHQIMKDLRAGRSTAEAIALRCKKSTTIIEVTLARLKKEEKIVSHPICDGLLNVWMLNTSNQESKIVP